MFGISGAVLIRNIAGENGITFIHNLKSNNQPLEMGLNKFIGRIFMVNVFANRKNDILLSRFWRSRIFSACDLRIV